MAVVTTNVLMGGLSGTFGNTLVFKTMRGKTFVSAKARKPDKKKETIAQRSTRVTFRQASEWAQMTLLNPEQKRYYQQRAKALKLPNAYTAAITDYMRKPKVMKEKQGDATTYSVNKPGFAIKHVSVQVTDTSGVAEQPDITMRQYNDMWLVRYNPGDRTVSSFTLIITDNTSREITFANE